MYRTTHGLTPRTSFVRSRHDWRLPPATVTTILCVALLAVVSTDTTAFDESRLDHTVEADIIAGHAETAWLDGAATRALHMLDRGLRTHPNAFRLYALRGHILAASRRHRDAIEAYDMALKERADAIDIHWAQWSVFRRAGWNDQAIATLQRLAALDDTNPLAPFRLARELRKLDRLEESLVWYETAVAMLPDIPGWRMALARARFDVLDGPGARDEVQHILRMVTPDSHEAAAARSLLSVIYGATKERGRRFEPILTPGESAAKRKEWSSIRADAWRLFEARRYEEVEALYRKILDLNPGDYAATHELGITLLELGRCEDAIAVFETLSTLNPSDEVYADAFFRVGQCLMAMERWADALVYFDVLYEAAVDFEERTVDAPPKAGIRVLDKHKLAVWVARAKHKMAEQTDPKEDETPRADANAATAAATPDTLTEEALYRKIATERLPPRQQVDPRGSLMGRDADFSVFRYVIAAHRVMRDDQPTGAHSFIPIEPHDTFPVTQQDIYLAFALVSASYDDVPLSAECFRETSQPLATQQPVAQDRVIMGMGDQSGYFLITPPDTGWSPGLHRCGLFIGGETSAYTHADEIRFRIVRRPRAS